MVCVLVSEAALPPASEALATIAHACSPRVRRHGSDAVVFDVDGLSRVCGPPAVIGREVTALAVAAGLTVRMAMAGTSTAAWILAHAQAGTTVVESGTEARVLAPLPLRWLTSVLEFNRTGTVPAAGTAPAVAAPRAGRTGGRHYRMAPAWLASRGRSSRARAGAAAATRLVEAWQERFAIFERWGLQTCGALAALPRADVQARLGPVGARLHQAACGEDAAPFVPADAPPVFVDRLELEWPIDGLEPLSFVLARQCDRLSARLERADRGAVAVRTRLTLVTRATHERVLHLPAPMREARVLRTLVLLDLESHPPAAAIDAVELSLDVMPGRIVQGSLLARSVPSPESLSTLLARLGALVGESRVGAPILPDTHDARAVAHKPFHPLTAPIGPIGPSAGRSGPPIGLRRFRVPLAARVVLDHGVPVRVWPDARGVSGGSVTACAGPWRTSGGWWAPDAWDRDEWDVELVAGGLYRVTRMRATGVWLIEGVFD